MIDNLVTSGEIASNLTGLAISIGNGRCAAASPAGCPGATYTRRLVGLAGTTTSRKIASNLGKLAIVVATGQW